MLPADATITYAEHALDVLDAAVALIGGGQACALVVSLAIEGGAAREVGSLAVVAQNGAMTGYLSNGCIDRDIVHQGLAALASGQVRPVRYGAGSPFMDLKLPCGGALSLVIDPAPDLGTLRAARDALRARTSAVLSFCPDTGLIAGGAGPVRFRYAPKPALVLAGRGAILRATADLAARLDFDLHIASPDAADLETCAALGPTSLQRMTSPDLPLNLPVDAHCAVLLLFHDHEWEQTILHRAAPMRPFFIGAMGSKKTHAIRLQNLRDRGLSDALCDTIRGPVGLVASLRHAPAIAVSALAEVIAHVPPLQMRLA